MRPEGRWPGPADPSCLSRAREKTRTISATPLLELSTDPATGDTYRIEVKARLAGSSDFWVTHNEVITGKNASSRYRLALVKVDPRGPEFDEVRYLDDRFATVEMGEFEATGHTGDWTRNWTRGRAPF